MFYIDQFVYANKMRRYHPGERAVFSFVTMIICLTAKSLLIDLLVIGIMVGMLVLKAKIPWPVVLKLMSVPMSFLVIGVLTIALSFGRTDFGMAASFPIGGYYLGVSQAGLKTAGLIFLQALSSVTCLYFLALTVPMIELIFVLQSCKVPALVIELMMLIYRFIFVFVETAFNIYTAQSSRWGYCNFRRSLYSFGILFANLWGKVFLKSRALLDSLMSRGYEGELKVLNPRYTCSWGNIFVFCFIDCGLVMLALI
ncbi:cobalt ECF transporter T component CbiQ [Candidatus Formimonas warabiya]|uniref:Cobalt ECF transporter T component CbiQ n=1 Tax=Formimonas warabiya TaxID=1761012 RepID=A0A3G1KZZ1_FORW1|nr:cobalt ECF transporter T component CbiQ [Candidatus Formimonas warabiya]ATW28106.1 cobalt ECF transporter T component CbiQ [Candidatus Formimonas warabiya]